VGFLTDERRKKKMSTTNVGTKAMHISLELEKMVPKLMNGCSSKTSRLILSCRAGFDKD
jgi:hypothetical protein